MSLLCQIRLMRREDIDDVLTIQAACYTAIVPESRASLLAKLDASPSTCFVAEHIAGAQQGMAGYLFAMPWRLSTPPQLDAPNCILPAHPDCLYLHDLAVAPNARKTGAGQALVAVFMERLSTLPLQHASLISIQASAPYWQRHGFRIVAANAAIEAKLASYSTDAVYMQYSMAVPHLKQA